ncbi:MAG: hypothetical protein JWN34_4135 [Bryobacterales bacterium]|nr:hypothetical protein [Bryobacterales bacterium]
MISEMQLMANQANAQKSTGPRTDEGKATARFNARRHGLTGQFYCMSEGDEAAYRVFESNLLADLKPVGAYESQLAISVIQDQWRLNRSRGVEFNAFAQGHAKPPRPPPAAKPNCSPGLPLWKAKSSTPNNPFRSMASFFLRPN